MNWFNENSKQSCSEAATEVFHEKKFRKVHRKDLCWRLFFDKVGGLSLC